MRNLILWQQNLEMFISTQSHIHPKNVAGQSAPAKFNGPQWALILFESGPTLKKHDRAARKTVRWG